MDVPRVRATAEAATRRDFECPHCKKNVRLLLRKGERRPVHIQDGFVRNLACPHCGLPFDVEITTAPR